MNLYPLNTYLDRLAADDNVSPHTLKNYRSSLTRFLTWLGDRPFNGVVVNEYLRQPQFSHKPTRNVNLVRISAFARFCKADLTEAVRAKEEIKQADALTSKQVTSLVSAADSETAAVIRFLCETGLRFNEFCEMNLQHDVTDHGDGDVILHVLGKGLKHRDIALNSLAQSVISQLPDYGTRQRPHYQMTLRRRMAKAGLAAGLGTHIHPHRLRASFISIMLNEKGIDSAKVAKIVGHSKIDTMVKHYYKPSVRALCDAMASQDIPSMYTEGAVAV